MKFSIQKDNNDIVKHEVDDIILQENKILSVKYEAKENTNAEVDENNLYDIDNMSIDERK